MNQDSFWMVWGERQGVPTVKHDTEERAEREAERLAQANPGVVFYVLRATEAFRSYKPVERFVLVEPVPF